MSQYIDITGQPFGRWTVLGRAESQDGRAYWHCRCICGSMRDVHGKSLRQGKSTSCGCVWKELPHEYAKTHGMTNTREYHSWAGMKSRCTNPRDRAYARYGGRGITVCDAWVQSFESFYKDMGPCPSPKHSLERRNNEKGYAPDNCYWATSTQQNRNRCNTRLLTLNGETKPLPEWAEVLGIAARLIALRLWNGWSHEKALLTPVRMHRRHQPGT